MIIKVTHPIHNIEGRVAMPGETIDAPRGKALEYIGNGWAIEVAEASIKIRKVKNGSRKNSQ
jgi:hypothetical protein